MPPKIRITATPLDPVAEQLGWADALLHARVVFRVCCEVAIEQCATHDGARGTITDLAAIADDMLRDLTAQIADTLGEDVPAAKRDVTRDSLGPEWRAFLAETGDDVAFCMKYATTLARRVPSLACLVLADASDASAAIEHAVSFVGVVVDTVRTHRVSRSSVIQIDLREGA